MGQIKSQMKVRGAFTSPTVLEELLDTPDGLQQIAQTDLVMYGGGPLAPLAGDRISDGFCGTKSVLHGIRNDSCGTSLYPTRAIYAWDSESVGLDFSLGDLAKSLSRKMYLI